MLGGIRYDGIAYITRIFVVLFKSVAGWGGQGWFFLVTVFRLRIEGMMLVVAPDSAGLNFVSI